MTTSLIYEPTPVFPTKTIVIRPGLHMMVSSGRIDQTTIRRTGSSSPVFELSYSRSGSFATEIQQSVVELRPNYALLGFLERVHACSQYECGDEVQLYSIWIEPSVFDGFCEAVSGADSLGFNSFSNGQYSSYEFKIDAREESILNKLDRYFLGNTGSVNRLLLESNILELLSFNIGRLLNKNKNEKIAHGLTRSDIECMIHTREILLNRLESPPTLVELAHIVHMNDCKLKRSFKAYYQQTVYEFIREQRFEKAFSLLERGACNVSESASAVGYRNASHFSEAFQRRFGISPSNLMKQ